VVEYLDQKFKITPEGKIAEPTSLVPPKGHVIKFTGAGQDGDWRKLKVTSSLFSAPFPVLALPRSLWLTLFVCSNLCPHRPT
jgi:hypothetical protein